MLLEILPSLKFTCYSSLFQLELCHDPHSLWVATTNSTINNWVRTYYENHYQQVHYIDWLLKLIENCSETKLSLGDFQRSIYMNTLKHQ